ncbi:hypothetical protein [Lacticaseibacillus nasuensis]|uniref:hypothetical protein n=1 Tax=Lacticaseibacillus nasuensis TaxID=944671 RepID=UPI0006D0AB06|nr:hypothetical protein [Lacticaseibacillus nasuensis]
MSWTSLAQTVGASLGGSYLFSWLMAVIAGNTTQQLVNRTGRSNGQLWFMKPGILVHEALHAVVGLVFGLHITAFSLRPTADSAAHVSFRYASHSWRARLGLFFSASAPVWGISATLLLLGKRAWWPQQAWAAISPHNLAPDWPWVAGWALLTVMLTFGLALSHQDLVNMWRGTPFFGGAVGAGLCGPGVARACGLGRLVAREPAGRRIRLGDVGAQCRRQSPGDLVGRVKSALRLSVTQVLFVTLNKLVDLAHHWR